VSRVEGRNAAMPSSRGHCTDIGTCARVYQGALSASECSRKRRSTSERTTRRKPGHCGTTRQPKSHARQKYSGSSPQSASGTPRCRNPRTIHRSETRSYPSRDTAWGRSSGQTKQHLNVSNAGHVVGSKVKLLIATMSESWISIVISLLLDCEDNVRLAFRDILFDAGSLKAQLRERLLPQSAQEGIASSLASLIGLQGLLICQSSRPPREIPAAPGP